MIDATVDVDRFFLMERKCKIGSAKHLVEKEKTGNVQLRYINDIHVIDGFFAR
jgi:hypothetical protein